MPEKSVKSDRAGITSCNMRARLSLVFCLLSGCSPTLEIGGAYFPDWLVSAIAGLFAVAGLRAALLWLGLDHVLEPRVFAYPAWAISLTLLIYLLLFS